MIHPLGVCFRAILDKYAEVNVYPALCVIIEKCKHQAFAE